jgi:hypothetical protein
VAEATRKAFDSRVGVLLHEAAVHDSPGSNGGHDPWQLALPLAGERIVRKYAEIGVAARSNPTNRRRSKRISRTGGVGAKAFLHGEILIRATGRAIKIKSSDGSADTKAWIATDDRPVASEGEACTNGEKIAESEEGVHALRTKACRRTARIVRFVEWLHAGNAARHPRKFRVIHGLAMFVACNACMIFWRDGIECDAQRLVSDDVDAW